MSGDLKALLLSYLYVLIIVAVGEVGRRRGLSREVARKVIHVGVGLWVFGTLFLFQSRYMAAIAPVTAAMGNWVIHRKGLLKAVEAEADNLGTVWFPIAFAVLILFAWEWPAAVAGGVIAMTIGDALASLVGQRWGRHHYAGPGGARKSLEGSLAMLVGTFVAVLVTVAWVTPPTQERPWTTYLGATALAAVVATSAEALGSKGRDNLWVPLSAGAIVAVALPIDRLAMANALGIGAVLALAIGTIAWMKGSLRPSGVLGAVLTGTLLFGFGGWPGGLALVGFFLSSSLLSRLFRRRKASAEAEYAKGGARDLGQALANGGFAAAAALGLGLTGDPRLMGALLGALAAANADTWATELGVLSRSRPRLITTLRAVPPGTSGAVSAVGTLAALGGALFVGLVAAIAAPHLWGMVPWIAVAGLGGAWADSLLGATVQGLYWCPACEVQTERQIHKCGARATRHRGLTWLGNDLVNLAATGVGALIGFLAM